MKTKKSKRSYKKTIEYPISWLPIDSRFITPLFSFGSVRGIARLFLEIEIILSLLIVLGTLILAAIKIISFFM